MYILFHFLFFFAVGEEGGWKLVGFRRMLISFFSSTDLISSMFFIIIFGDRQEPLYLHLQSYCSNTI